jgi:hypothetical protein
MAIEYLVMEKSGMKHDEAFLEVAALAVKLRDYLDRVDVQDAIRDRHVLGASSAAIQGVILPNAIELGFQSEKEGLFAGYQVAGLRPDYYRPVGRTGILLEVERGKTTTNNMDLLDLWKCHICDRASYLFLVVPRERPSANGTVLRHFKQVSKRLGTFFEPKNYVNVDAVHLFGY